MGYADVFLSHHVASMKMYACQLNDRLKQLGIETFICSGMKPGDDFRQLITVNAVKCKIFVAFINEAWAASEECVFEFNCALRSFTMDKTPKIVPIIIGGFRWIDVVKYPDVFNITANTNCAVLEDDNWDKVFEEIIGAVKAHPGILGAKESGTTPAPTPASTFDNTPEAAAPQAVAPQIVTYQAAPRQTTAKAPSISYVSCKMGDSVPANAVQGGYDDGPSYHARGPVSGKTIPGKVGVKSANDRRLVGAGIPYGNNEHRLNRFEVLTFDGKLKYVKCNTGKEPPKNAVQGGYDGGPSFHARAIFSGVTIPGKVGVNNIGKLKGACVGYGGSEIRIHEFDILVIDS